MEVFAIDAFYGRNTHDTQVLLPSGFAVAAVDVDFSDKRGTLKGCRMHEMLHEIGSVLSLYCWRGSVLSTTSSGFYDGGTEKQIGGTTAWGGWAIFTDGEGCALGANGTKVVKYKGTDLYEYGVSVPTLGTFSATGTGTGSFTVGNWKYTVTFVNADGFEGNACATITAGSQGASKASCALANIPLGSAAEKIVARRIYRTTNGGDTTFLLAVLNDNTTTTYTDTTLDIALGTSTPPINHNKLISTATIIERAGYRIFAVNPSMPRRLLYSLPIPYAEGFPPEYYEDFPDDIVALKALADMLIVVTRSRPFLFAGLDNTGTMYTKELQLRVPGDSKWGIDQMDNKVFWRGPMGIYMTNGVGVFNDSESVLDIFMQRSAACMLAVDHYNRMYIVANDVYTDSEFGRIVRLQSTHGEITDSITFSAEVGRIVRIESTEDDYIFNSERGRIVALGSPDWTSSSAIIREMKDGMVIWHTRSEQIQTIAFDYTHRTLYGGTINGVVKAYKGDRMPWRYKTVSSFFNFPNKRKRLDRIRVRVNGKATINVYGDDDILLHTYEVDVDTFSMVEIPMPDASWAYTFQFEIIGAANAELEPPVIFYFDVENA